jgi:hypothetical protein
MHAELAEDWMKNPKDNVDDPSTLVDRLNGIYPAWVPGVYKPTPLNLEAAREIERLRAAPSELVKAADTLLSHLDWMYGYSGDNYVELRQKMQGLRAALDKVKS